MGEHSRDVLVGIVLGALIVVGAMYFGIQSSAKNIQTVSLPSPLFFIPK